MAVVILGLELSREKRANPNSRSQVQDFWLSSLDLLPNPRLVISSSSVGLLHHTSFLSSARSRALFSQHQVSFPSSSPSPFSSSTTTTWEGCNIHILKLRRGPSTGSLALLGPLLRNKLQRLN